MRLTCLLWVVLFIVSVDGLFESNKKLNSTSAPVTSTVRPTPKEPPILKSQDACRKQLKNHFAGRVLKVCQKEKDACALLTLTLGHKELDGLNYTLNLEVGRGRTDCINIVKQFIANPVVKYMPNKTADPPVPCFQGKTGKPGVNCVKGKCVPKRHKLTYLQALLKNAVKEKDEQNFVPHAVKTLSMYIDNVQLVPDSMKTCLCQEGIADEASCIFGCSPGSYGEYCLRQCGHCKAKPCQKKTCPRSPICDPVTAKCQQCQPMYKPPFCKELIDCKPQTTCLNGVCINATYCLCEPGYYGYKCKEKCKRGWYGTECPHACSETCRNSCELEYGTCIDGCLKGYFGSHCNLTIDDIDSTPIEMAEVRAEVDFVVQQNDGDAEASSPDVTAVQLEQLEQLAVESKQDEKGRAIWGRLSLPSRNKMDNIRKEVKSSISIRKARRSHERRDQERQDQERRDQQRRGQLRRGQRSTAISDKVVDVFEGLVLMYYSTCKSAERGFKSMKAIKSFGQGTANVCFRKMHLKFNSANKRLPRSHERFERQPAGSADLLTTFDMRLPAEFIDTLTLTESLARAVGVASGGFNVSGFGIDVASIDVRQVISPDDASNTSPVSGTVVVVIIVGCAAFILTSVFVLVTMKTRNNKRAKNTVTSRTRSNSAMSGARKSLKSDQHESRKTMSVSRGSRHSSRHTRVASR